ncbi:MAG: hypothetical protein ACE5H2_01450 [Terriglobia bacterium]
MRRTRFVNMLFLVLSLVFFFVQDFRWALQVPLLDPDLKYVERFGRLTPARVHALGQAAQERGDAQALAFVALHLPTENRDEIFRFTQQAVARDATLTWLYYHTAMRYREDWNEAAVAERVQEWIARLEAFAPDNAIPRLLGAEFIRARATNWPDARGPLPSYLEGLAGQEEWRAAMAGAFRQPRYETYAVRRFELERQILRQQGWVRPAVVILSLVRYPIVNFRNLADYVHLEVNYLGRAAEHAGRRAEALARYRATAAFGRRMGLGATSLLDKDIAQETERKAYKPLLPALRRAGLEEETARAKIRLQELDRTQALRWGEDPLARNSSYSWSAQLVGLFFWLVVFFGVLTVICVGYVNAKRWVRREKRGRLYQLVTVAENYMPILLFLSCLGLYLIYTPYAYNFRYYMRASGEIHSLDPLVYNVLPLWEVVVRGASMPIRDPFASYVNWAVAGVVLLVLLAGWGEWRARRRAR